MNTNPLYTETNEVSGFYYDLHLNDPRTRMSLHPNTAIYEYVRNIDKEKTSSYVPRWVTISDEGTPHRSIFMGKGGPDGTQYIKMFHAEDKEDQIGVSYKNMGEGKDGKMAFDVYCPYAKESICSSILEEDFKISIANTFTDMGGDPIGTMFNSAKSSLPLITEVGKFLESISKKTKESAKKMTDDGMGSSWVNKIGDLLKAFSGAGKLQSTLMNRALVTQGTRFSFYSGTGISSENLSMKFTIFPTWEPVKLSDGTKKIKFMTVYDQINLLLPYVIGDFVPFTFAGFESNAHDSKIVSFAKDAANIAGSIASEYASWQLPPGGFEAYPRDIDIVQKGTVKLRLGTLYALENLIISGCSFSVSKQLIKNPEMSFLSASASQLTPAYCEVQLSLKPITKYSRKSLIRFIEGQANMTDRKETFFKMRDGMKAALAKLGRNLEEEGEAGWKYDLLQQGKENPENVDYTVGEDLSATGKKDSKSNKSKRKRHKYKKTTNKKKGK